MQINQFVKKIHATAKKKGWWKKKRSPLEVQMLVVSEIAEATEEVRKGMPSSYLGDNDKPSGELIELADACIRIMDYCGYMKWDLEKAIKDKMAYNETRSYRHGGKKY